MVAGILALRADWSDGLGKSFEGAHDAITGDARIDCGLAVSNDAFDTYDAQRRIHRSSPRSLAVFLFRFLHDIQSLGNAPAADWNAYACQFASSALLASSQGQIKGT